MKKYIALFSVSAALVISIILSGSIVKSKIVKAEIITLQSEKVESTITCSGRVENTASRSVYAKERSIVQEIYVQVGDMVKEGQTLMCVCSNAVSTNATAASGIPSGIDYSNIQNAQQIYQSYLNSTSSKSNSASSSSGSSSKSVEVKRTDITAPISGVVSEINVNSNSSIDENSPVIVIADSNSLQVRLSVNESQVSDLKVGQQALITGVGFQNSQYTGTVKSISNIAKQLAITKETVVEVLVSVDNCENSDIKPGFTAKCKIITSNNLDMLIVPYDAVRANDDGSEYVYVYQDGKAVKTDVKTGKEFENGFEIKSGLSPDNKIIINPDAVYNNSPVIVADKDKDVVSDHD